MNNTAYVYAIVINGIVRYIGKGSGKRPKAHIRIVQSIVRRRAAGETVKASPFYERLSKAWRDGAEIANVVIAQGLSDDDAYALEIETIASYPKRQLWNHWAGGLGSSRGHRKPETQKAAIAASNRETWSDQKLRVEQAERMKVHWLRPEYRAALSKPKPKEQAEKIRAKAKARWGDPVFREKMRAIHTSAEFKARRSEATKRGWNTRRAAVK